MMKERQVMNGVQMNRDAKARSRGLTRLLSVIVSVTAVFSASLVLAATGDNLAQFDAVVTAGIPPCGTGTGVAYDGTDLILSCWGSNVLERVNAATHLNAGSVAIGGLPFGDDIEALAWDATRNRLWTCNAHYQVVLVDVAAGGVDVSQPALFVPGCTDGLAYDASDDTLWLSPDVSDTVYHYALDGTLLGGFSIAGLLGSCGNSGIAVGGPDLYLANNGCSQIYTVPKDFSTSVLFASFPARLEDLECDGKTFSPLGAIWSIDAYDRTLNAWEIAPGLCAFGGLARCGDGHLDPGERCDDGNLANGDGCDSNCQIEVGPCGNGILDPGEQCDGSDDTACSGRCQVDCTCPSNNPPDCNTAAAGPAELWPPNHKFAKVSVVGVTDSDGDPITISITGITQDEPLDSWGDGHTCPDGAGVGTDTALVRAERARSRRNSRDGRVYHVSFTADDGRGGQCSGTAQVCVPPNHRPDATCIDEGPLFDSTVPCS